MDELLSKARAGDESARDELLFQVRSKLRQWAETALNANVSARMDVSDLTQNTLLDVHQQLHQFVGTSSAEFEAWLRTSLQHNILDSIRKATAQRRSVLRELPLNAPLRPDGPTVGETLNSDVSTPSVRAIRIEDADRVKLALEQLPDDQRLIVKLVHLQGSTIAMAAEQLARSPGAAAKLLQRGIAALRRRLEAMDE